MATATLVLVSVVGTTSMTVVQSRWFGTDPKICVCHNTFRAVRVQQ